MRKSHWLLLPLILTPLCGDGIGVSRSAPTASLERHRSPLDLAVFADGRRALTANDGSDSVSLLDLTAGRVLAELPCGERPSAVACSADGRRAAVSNLWSGTVSLLEVGEAQLQLLATVPVGPLPRGIVLAPDGESFYVAVAGAHEVAHVSWPAAKVQQRWPAPAEPRRLAITPDGRLLAAACGRAGQVRCWETKTGAIAWERTIYDSFNVHGLGVSPDGKDFVASYVNKRFNPITKHHIDQGWALNSRLARLAAEPPQNSDFTQIGLDIRGEAVGDPCAVAFGATGEFLAVAAGGTHELLVMRTDSISWSSGDAGDFIDVSLELDRRLFRRVPLGGRPVAVEFLGKRDQAAVANYMLDAVQVVDVRTGNIARQIPLGGPKEWSLARKGEAVFYDARRSHHQWFSCHTCHPDGHTSGRTFDTLNDDSYGNPKMTPTLRGVARTAPWTWHGWQDSLDAAVEKSLTETLFGPEPSAEDVKAVVAYLGTLDHPPNPNRAPDGKLTPAAERGKAIFEGKARCARCHQGEDYTSGNTYDVKVEEDGSTFERWNPPSLRGLFDRGPYMHDGRAESLDDLLRSPHSPEKLGGKSLTDREREDLVAFLRSL